MQAVVPAGTARDLAERDLIRAFSVLSASPYDSRPINPLTGFCRRVADAVSSATLRMIHRLIRLLDQNLRARVVVP